MTEATRSADVIVVGCGPVGVAAAHLLGRYGITTLVIERDLVPYNLPRAVHFDHEIMRIFQSAQLSELLLPHLVTPEGSVHFGMDGTPIRPFRRMSPTGKYGWAEDYFFYQPDFENVLRMALAGRPTVELALGCTVTGIEQDRQGATVLAEGAGGAFRARARFILACDGGRSTVRRSLGIGLIDLGFDEPWIVVDATVPGRVTMPAFSGLPHDVDVQKVMFIIADPARPTSYVPSSGDHRRWEFMLLPNEDPEEAVRPANVATLLEPWLREQPHEVVRATTYRFHSLLAERWRFDHVFLLGDAAHQTPPFFGQGLCHGIRDAANLAWKIDLVLRGHAAPGLLSTYEAERLPQVRAVIETSMRTGRYICTLDPELARQRDAMMRESPQSGPVPNLIPALTVGILDPRSKRPPTGQRFVQPRMTDGAGRVALLDDLTGGGFVMLASSAAALAPLPPECDLALSRFLIVRPGTLVAQPALFDHSGEFAAWLAAFDCDGLILRPDGYVYGIFTGGDEAQWLMAALAGQLRAGAATVTTFEGVATSPTGPASTRSSR